DSNTTAALTQSAAGLPTSLQLYTALFRSSGTIDAGAANAGPLTVTITVTDGISTATISFGWVVDSNITITPIANQHSKEGDSPSLRISACDAAASATLHYSAAGLPTGPEL